MIRFCNTSKKNKNIIKRAYNKFRINENVLILSNINLDNFFRVNYSNGKQKISIQIDNMVLDNYEIKILFTLILLLEKDIIDKNTKFLIQKIEDNTYTINKFKNYNFIKIIQIDTKLGQIDNANLIIKTKTREYEISVLKQVNNMYQSIEQIDNNEYIVEKKIRNSHNRYNYNYDDHYSNYYYNYSNNYNNYNNYKYDEIDNELYNFSCA